MDRKILFRKKAILTSISVAIIILATSTIVPATFESKTINICNNQIKFNEEKFTNNNEETEFEIKLEYILEYMYEHFERNYYNSIIASLCKLQRKYRIIDIENTHSFDTCTFIEYLSLQDDKTIEKVNFMISSLYDILQPQDLSNDTKNTDEYYSFTRIYRLNRVLQFGIDTNSWFRGTVPAVTIICFIIAVVAWAFAILEPTFITPAFIITAIASFTPFLYIAAVLYTGGWLIIHSVDMTFYVCNNFTGLPINNLTLTAIPFDNELPKYCEPYIFTAKQHKKDGLIVDGLYFIPPYTHVVQTDIPPGKYYFTLSGIGSDGLEYYKTWDNNENPFPSNYRYSETIKIDPMS